MNILRIIPTMDPKSGGPSQGIRNSIPELSKIDIINEVLCLDDADEEYIGKDSFAIHAIGKPRGVWKYNSNLIPWLESNIHRFDVIIIHGLWFYYGYATHKAIKQYKKKNASHSPRVYVMPHGMLDPWFQRAPGRKIKAIRNLFYWKFIERYIVNEADGLLFTCEEELKLARLTFYGYHPKNELNVGYGIDYPPENNLIMDQTFEEFFPVLKNMPFLLFMSRIDIKKGVDLLIRSYLSLKSEGFTLPKLVIAGPGLETYYGQQLKKMASNDVDIIFPDMLTGDLKWATLYRCEAFILPSHQENFGIAIVEAMACNKAVLISNQINIWREIDAGMAGLIAPDTYEGVRDLLKNWTSLTLIEKDRMGKCAKYTFEKYFTITEGVKRLASIVKGNV